MSQQEWNLLKTLYDCNHEIFVQVRVPGGEGEDKSDEKVITRPRKYYLIENLHVACESHSRAIE